MHCNGILSFLTAMSPLPAAGGTICQVLEDIVSRGGNPENVRVISVVCAPPALKKLSEGFPGLKVYTGGWEGGRERLWGLGAGNG